MTELVINWYLQERTEDINRYRLSVAFMRNIADEFYERELDTSIFQNVFKFEHNNRTIQNATWALAQIGLKNPGALRFLEKQMSSPKLFRGNKTYIAEALIGLDPVHYSNVLREHYFHQINDMDSRIQGTSLPFRQQPAIQSRCLVDVIKYRPLGSEIPANEIENIRKEFLKGTNDVDLHRTLAWILMRSMSDNGKGMITVIESLFDEYDQTNAYYVSKFIMGPGLMMFPSLLLNRRTLQSLRSIKNRWPKNFYFSESAARLSMKIKSR